MDEFLKEAKLTEDEIIFFGDSLNDESVFKEIDHCVGVSNIEKVKAQFKHLPQVILEGEENKGIHGVLNYLKSIFSWSKYSSITLDALEKKLS